MQVWYIEELLLITSPKSWHDAALRTSEIIHLAWGSVIACTVKRCLEFSPDVQYHGHVSLRHTNFDLTSSTANLSE